MKIAKTVSVIFAVLGAVLMLGTVIVCLVCLDAPAKLLEYPQEAERRSEEMMEAVVSGDYATAAGIMYGQPELGGDAEPAEEMAKLVWEAFRGSISYEFSGKCYATDSGVARDASITSLDVTTVMDSLTERMHTLLTQRVEAAEDMEEIYDEDNNFRDSLVQEVLRQAVEQAIREDGQTVTRNVTLELVYQDGQWWVVPDQELLQAISGGLA